MADRWMRAALVAACVASFPARAHEPGASPVHPVLAPLPAALSGVTVEVAETLAPQLLVANHAAEPLEILDANGRAFIRIGPAGVEADLAAAAWYETLATARPPVPEAARDPAAPAQWRPVKAAPEFGWFDPRLNVGRVKLDAQTVDADAPATVGAWSIPVRIGGRASAIDGRFDFRPPNHGAYVARLDTPADFPASVGLQVSQGATPGLFLSNSGPETVTVIGVQGEPVIRVSPSGVEVNTGSPMWKQLGREERASVATDGEHWMLVSKHPAYTWLEPRATTRADGPHEEKDWTVPVLVGARPFDLHGTSVWQSSAEAGE